MTQNIEITRDGAVQCLRMNRPEKKNALTREMYRALIHAFETGDSSPDIAVHLILGVEGAFSAGNDIADFLAAATGDGTMVAMESTDVFRFINLLPQIKKPVVAAVDGVAVGIGTTMLFHFDLIYASNRAMFQTPFLDLGLVPEAASTITMPACMGYARAFEMLVLGEPFDAQRMENAGLINAIFEPQEVEVKAREAAHKLAAKPRQALAASRKMMRSNSSVLAAQTRLEAEAFAKGLQSKEARTAFQKFMSKS